MVMPLRYLYGCSEVYGILTVILQTFLLQYERNAPFCVTWSR